MDFAVSDLDPHTRRVTFSGPLSGARIDEIGRRFVTAVCDAGRNVVLDMSTVSYIASRGLQLLLETAERLAKKGLSMVLVKCQPDVSDLVSILGLSSLLSLEADDSSVACATEFELTKDAYL